MGFLNNGEDVVNLQFNNGEKKQATVTVKGMVGLVLWGVMISMTIFFSKIKITHTFALVDSTNMWNLW